MQQRREWSRQTWQRKCRICQNAKWGDPFRRHKGRGFGQIVIFLKENFMLTLFMLTSQKMLGSKGIVYTVTQSNNICMTSSWGHHWAQDASTDAQWNHCSQVGFSFPLKLVLPSLALNTKDVQHVLSYQFCLFYFPNYLS